MCPSDMLFQRGGEEKEGEKLECFILNCTFIIIKVKNTTQRTNGMEEHIVSLLGVTKVHKDMGWWAPNPPLQIAETHILLPAHFKNMTIDSCT